MAEKSSGRVWKIYTNRIVNLTASDRCHDPATTLTGARRAVTSEGETMGAIMDR